MVFASSKDALRRSLVGISTEIQGTDFSEVAHEVGACLYALCMRDVLIVSSVGQSLARRIIFLSLPLSIYPVYLSRKKRNMNV